MNKYKQIVYLAVLMLGFGSCNDYLDREPLSEYLSDGFYKTPGAIREGTTGVYNNLYMESNSLPFCTLLDMYTPMGVERAENSGIGINTIDLTTNGVVESSWAKNYDGISRANAVLAGAQPFISKMDFADKQQSIEYLTEIKVLRAFYYHNLVFQFGDVPFDTKPVDPKEKAVRTPWSEILESLFTDLDDAAELLPNQAKSWGRVDRAFALGLKARMALYAGSWCKEGFGMNGVKDPVKAEYYFKIARDASNKVITSCGRSLNPSFPDLFTRTGQMTAASKSEILFALMYSDQGPKKMHYQTFGEQSRIFAQSGRFPTNFLVDQYEMANGKRIDQVGSGYDPKKPFVSRDPRLKQTVYTHQDTIIGNSGGKKVKFLMDLFNSTTKSFDANMNITMISNLDHTGSVAQYGYIQSGVGYSWKKYNHFDDEIVSNASYNVILMRYPEILLTYAEAKIELDEIDNSVYAAIDEVRARSKMPAVLVADPLRAGDQAKMRQIVRRERKVELARESGIHFYDMRRWRTAQLENAEMTYGFPTGGYTTATADMVPSYGAPGSQEDLNDCPRYAAYGDKLRKRDVARPENWAKEKPKAMAAYLWPIPAVEIQKAPYLGQNDGYAK